MLAIKTLNENTSYKKEKAQKLIVLLKFKYTTVYVKKRCIFFYYCIYCKNILYYFAQRFYITTSRQLKRLESKTRSPIYSHFGETVTGASVIRAFGLQGEFILESQKRVDTNQVFTFASNTANR